MTTANSDPNGPADRNWGPNWAGGKASALMADYDWKYNDGLGSPNLGCTRATPNGCWDHRLNILSNYGLHPSMGAAWTKVGGVTSLTELLARHRLSKPGHETPRLQKDLRPPP
jgi:hypothetical protein